MYLTFVTFSIKATNSRTFLVTFQVAVVASSPEILERIAALNAVCAWRGVASLVWLLVPLK